MLLTNKQILSGRFLIKALHLLCFKSSISTNIQNLCSGLILANTHFKTSIDYYG